MCRSADFFYGVCCRSFRERSQVKVYLPTVLSAQYAFCGRVGKSSHRAGIHVHIDFSPPCYALFFVARVSLCRDAHPWHRTCWWGGKVSLHVGGSEIFQSTIKASNEVKPHEFGMREKWNYTSGFIIKKRRPERQGSMGCVHLTVAVSATFWFRDCIDHML